MSQIINIPVDLRKYTNFKSNNGIDFYLAVDKNLNYIRKGDFVAFWSDEIPRKGIFGYGIILTDILKSSEIKIEQDKVYDRNNLQIGVKRVCISYEEPLIPDIYAKMLPSLNEHKQPIIIANSLNYRGYNIEREIKTFVVEYHHIFSRVGGYASKENFNFVLHLLRERHQLATDYKSYYKKMKDNELVCSLCEIDYEYKLGRQLGEKFMELHDTSNPNNEKYKKIDCADFIIVCPNCHKTEHEKIRMKPAHNNV